MQPIGIIHSCFKEKFGTPRQSGLLKHPMGKIELLPPYNIPEALQELESFSHLWIIFDFHLVPKKNENEFNPTVRPPRLGGNKRVGVFASRSPFRPNNLGLSAVKLERIEKLGSKIFIHISGQDLVDGTPVIDIKPYLPSADLIENASSGWTSELKPTKLDLPIHYSDKALDFLKRDPKKMDHLKNLIDEIITQDPRPAYYKEERNHDKKTSFSALLYDFDIHFKVNENNILVEDIEPRS